MQIDDINDKKFSVAVVCYSNMNRSMAAHELLRENGFNVKSFGAGDMVHVGSKTFDFNWTYNAIYEYLKITDEEFYERALARLIRNSKIKPKPEKFQESKEKFDIVITFSKITFDLVVNHLKMNSTGKDSKVQVINFDIFDSSRAASVGAHSIHTFLSLVEKTCENIDELETKFNKYKTRHNNARLFRTCFY